MSDQSQQILTEALKSYHARNLYSEQQVAGMVELLRKGELSVKSQLVKYSELGGLSPGQKVFQTRLKGLQEDIAATLKQVKAEQTLLIKTATRNSFQSGIQNGVSELKNAKFPRWELLNPETEAKLGKQVFSLIDRSALDFLLRFNIQLVGNVQGELLEGIKQAISLGLIRGDSIAEISRGLGRIITDPKDFRVAGNTVFKTAQQRMELITRTETIRAYNQGRLKFFDTINVRKVRWMAVGDERTCPICGGLDGQEYLIDALPPIPAHPACRCTTVASRARVCGQTLEKFASTEQGADCILVPEQLEELAKLANQEKSKINSIITEGNYSLLNTKTLQKLAQQRGIAVTRSQQDMIKLLMPFEPGQDVPSLASGALKLLMQKHHISVLRSKSDLVKLLSEWDKAHAITVPDFGSWSIVKLREEAKSQGISVMRTKDDLIKMLDSVEPGVTHSELKGSELSQKLSEFNIGKVRTKDELVGLLSGKIKQGQLGLNAELQVKKQLAEQIQKGKAALDEVIAKLKPNELIQDPTQLTAFLKTYEEGFDLLNKQSGLFLPADVSAYTAHLETRFSIWQSYVQSLKSTQLKTIVKQAKLEKWQWMNKDEMITMLTAKDTSSKQAVMESVLSKWEKWKVGQTGKPVTKAPQPVAFKPLVSVKSLPGDTWTEVDSRWLVYEKTAPFKFQGKADIDGAHTKYFFTDEKGEKWLFKPVSEAFRAHGDEVAYRIGRLLDPQAVEVRVVELNVPGRGPLKGSIQRWKTGLKDDYDFRNSVVTSLGPHDLEQLQREHVLDWLIGNHDAHAKQFIRHQDGQVYGIDKGQLYKFLGSDKLDIDYWPNKRWGEQEPIYNTIFRSFQTKQMDLDLNAVLQTIKQVERISDAEYIQILEPYASRRFGKGSANIKAFYEQALHRKNHIREDFESFYSQLLSKRLGKRSKFSFEEMRAGGDVKLTPEAEKIVSDAVNAGWQGKALSLDGDDIEDLNALVYVEKIKGTHQFQSKLRMKIRPDSEQKLLSLLDDSNSIGELKGLPLSEDKYFSDIVAGVKTLNHHVGAGDFEYNDAVIKNIRKLKQELQALKKAGDPEVVRMATTYQEAVNKILEGVKSGSKYKGQFKQYLRTIEKPAPKKDKSLLYKRQRILYEEKQNKKGELIIEKSQSSDLKKILRRDHANEGVEYRIDLGDGVEAVYKPWHDNNYYAHRGELELKTAGNADMRTVEKLITKLNDLGLDGRLASDADQELVYLVKQSYLAGEDATPGYKKMIKKLDHDNASKELRIKQLKEYWSVKLGVDDIATLPDYRPLGEYSLSGNASRNRIFTETAGYKNSYRFDVGSKELAKELNGLGLYHRITNGRDILNTIDNVLANNGAMVSTVEKIRLGLPVGGMSPLDDMETGGASYFFTRLRKLPSPKESGDVGLYFKKDLIRRLDAITYDGDKYGRVTGNTVRSNRYHSLKDYKQIAARSRSDETIFKNGVTLLDNIDHINLSSSEEKIRLIAIFKKHGIEQLPDGRDLNEMILVMGKR